MSLYCALKECTQMVGWENGKNSSYYPITWFWGKLLWQTFNTRPELRDVSPVYQWCVCF